MLLVCLPCYWANTRVPVRLAAGQVAELASFVSVALNSASGLTS